MRRNKRNSRNKKRQATSRPFSILFLIAIPGNFILGGIVFISFAQLLFQYHFGRSEVWALFVSGVLCALVLIGTTKMSRFRVLIHEIKHAIVVVLTGNSLKSIHVKEKTGHVEFSIFENKLHFAPIISLAPYFFPLFSLPMLVICIVLDSHSVQILAMLLGAALATDMSMAYTDLHPHQTDLQKVTGGPFVALLYLASTHFLWTSICLLWPLAGRNGYVYCGYILVDKMKILAQGIAQ